MSGGGRPEASVGVEWLQTRGARPGVLTQSRLGLFTPDNQIKRERECVCERVKELKRAREGGETERE